MRARSLCLRIAAIAAAVTALTACPTDGPPPPDSCDRPGAVSASTVAIGGAGDAGFVPLTDGAGVAMVYGPQGGAMIGVRLQIQGAELPACIAQQTTIASITDATVYADYSIPVHAYEQPDGSRATSTMWIQLGYPEPTAGERVEVEATVGGATARVEVVVDGAS